MRGQTFGISRAAGALQSEEREVGSWFRGAWNKNPTGSIGDSRPVLHRFFSHRVLSLYRASVAGDPPQPVRHLVGIEHECVLECWAEWHRRDVRAGDPADRGIQAGKAALSELSRNLCAESSGPVGLVDHGDPAGFLDGAHARLDIP